MSEPRGQHYVPQVYCRLRRRWQNLGVYRRPTADGQPPATFDTNIKNVAKVRDAYSIKTEHGRDRYIDQNFERVESLCSMRYSVPSLKVTCSAMLNGIL